jgi:hypothetical protein
VTVALKFVNLRNLWVPLRLHLVASQEAMYSKDFENKDAHLPHPNANARKK